MQKAFERVLGGEYKVVIEEELRELKQSDRLLFGEPCAVLHRTDINLGRPADECEAEDKSCYIVFLPSKYSIVCNKDFGSFKSKDGSVKLVSLNYFVENLLGFNFTFLQLIEPKAIIWSNDKFDSIIRVYKDTVENNKDLICTRYTILTSIAISIYNDIKGGKIKNDEARLNRLFLLYTVCEACKQLNKSNSLSLGELYDDISYRIVKNAYTKDKDLSMFNVVIHELKESTLNIEHRDKEHERVIKLNLKYKLFLNLISDTINTGLVQEGREYEYVN